MATAKAKTIKLLLNEGTLKGVISMEDSGWNSGELFSAPRDSVEDLIHSEACSKFGVYLLLSEDLVYIGQSSDLAKRIRQHIVGKSWWERVVILTTSNDSLNRSDIDYLETALITLASQCERLDCDNRNKGNLPKVSKFRKVELDQYLEEALFLIELIGITVFTKKVGEKKQKQSTLIQSVKGSTKKQIDIRAKRDAKEFLKEKGIILEDVFNYAKRQDDENVFWINPLVEMLEKKWHIVLNDQFSHEIILLEIPPHSIPLASDGHTGVFIRRDRPQYLDINIATNTFIEKRSKIDFSLYVVNRIQY